MSLDIDILNPFPPGIRRRPPEGFMTCWVIDFASFDPYRRPPDGYRVGVYPAHHEDTRDFEVGRRVLCDDEEMEGSAWERYQAIVERCHDAGHQW